MRLTSRMTCGSALILLALMNGQPRYLTLKQMLEEFIRHRLQVIRRRTEYLLREAKRRSHVLEGQLIAISSIEEVINIWRSRRGCGQSNDA